MFILPTSCANLNYVIDIAGANPKRREPLFGGRVRGFSGYIYIHFPIVSSPAVTTAHALENPASKPGGETAPFGGASQEQSQ